MFRQFEKESHIYTMVNSADKAELVFRGFNNSILFYKEVELKIPLELKCFYENDDHELHFFLTHRLFNLVLEEGGLPVFSIEENRVTNKYDILNKLYHQPTDYKYLNFKVANKNRVLCLKESYEEKNITPGDIILATITPGLHFTNLQYIVNKAMNIPNWRTLSINKLFDIKSYLRFPTTHVLHQKILHKLWSGKIKKIITPNNSITQSLESVIPDGMRAQIHANFWGLDNFIFDLCNILGISKYELYHNLSPNIGMIFITAEKDYRNICNSFSDEQNVNLIRIGHIADGNIGEKVNIHLY